MAFSLQPNNPALVVGVVVLIAIGIFALQSVQSPRGSAPTDFPPAPSLLSQEIPPGKEGLERAPELRSIEGYINTTEDLKIVDLKGSVVLVDFWTYSCINCIRTLPYLTEWDEKYRDKGLVIIGVHSPEFEFEKNFDNVQAAVNKYQIQYPVVLDNSFATWSAYNNRFWPRKYLVDADGFIRYDHIGEGAYEETEQKIIELLEERDAELDLSNMPLVDDPAGRDPDKFITPERYLGFDFMLQHGQPLGNLFSDETRDSISLNEPAQYTLPETLIPHLVYLEGEWVHEKDASKLVSDTGKVALYFTARELNMVAGAETPAAVKVLLGIHEIAEMDSGSDVSFDTGIPMVGVSSRKLYGLVDKESYDPVRITLEVSGAGFELYTFTFG